MGSRGYSGGASFQFEIERLKHKTTGAYILYDVDNVPDDYEYVNLTLEVEGESYYTRGRTYGEPEDCYPDEGETTINEITGPDNLDWEKLITNDERDAILASIIEQVIDD